MAERVTGAATDLDDFVFIYFGTGLGLGIVSDGRLERGGYGNAGEIGHVPVMVDGEALPLEDLVSRLSLRKHMARAGKVVDQVEDLEALFNQADPDMMDWLDRATTALTPAILMIENLFDPQTIVMGGAMPDPLLAYIISSVALPDMSVSNRPDRTFPRLTSGGSGRMPATRGAAALIINQTFTPQIDTAA